MLDFVLPKGKDGSDGGVTVDEELSSTSTNPVQNKVIYKALLNKADTDIFRGFILSSPTATIAWRQGSQPIGSINASNYTGTAAMATSDGDGNTITSTYAKKSDISGMVKSVNNIKPDSNGNVAITVSGGGNVTVDTALSATSTNPVQNKVIKDALDDKANLNKLNTFSKENWFEKGVSIIAYRDSNSAIKWYQSAADPPIAFIDDTNYTGNAASATKATQDGAGNVITETYATKSDISGVVKSVNGTKPDSNGNVAIAVSGGGNVTVDTALSATSTNPVQNRVIKEALDNKLSKTEIAAAAFKDGAGNIIANTYAKKTDISGMVKTVNGTAPDTNGNVAINVSGGGGVSTSESNTWTAQQDFQYLGVAFERYNSANISGSSVTPNTSMAVYVASGAFTINMATIASRLSYNQATVFSAYITSDADYALTISDAGTVKYIGSASDLAITSAGLLLNILMSKDGTGNLISIIQANKLA